MTSIEEHAKKIKEHLNAINRAIDLGAENWPSNIGFNASACATQFLELYLHKLGKIPIGKVVKHNWFKRPKEGQRIAPLVERKLNVDFPLRIEICSLIYDIEDKRENLIYGKTDKEQIKQILETFLKLRTILVKALEKEGMKIE